ncbi:MAG: hypothetical protein ACYS5V_07195 [Planctomycetota bacterium]|jgi:hypothetical protein
MVCRVSGGDLTITVNPQTLVLGLDCFGRAFEAGPDGPRFAIAGTPVQPAQAVSDGDGVSVELRGEGVSGRWKLAADAGGVRSVIEVDGAADVGVEIEIPLPLSGALELPTAQNWGVRIDRSCPPGLDEGMGPAGGQLQLAAADLGPCALAFIGLSDHTRFLPGTYAGVWRAGGYRGDDCLWLRLNIVGGVPFEISAHRDLEGVIDRYCRVLRERLGILTLADDPSVPSWLDELGIMLVMSMWRSDGVILHDFADALRAGEDLRDMGATGHVMLKLVGYQGPFDSHYPFFDPAEGLGGPDGFRALADSLHAAGNRFSLHFNIWGMDPYMEEFEQIEHLAVPYDRVYERIPTGQIGPYDGWPGPYPAEPVGFDSGFLPIEPVERTDAHLTFRTCEVPEPMEAYLTVAGVKDFASGRMRAVVGGRQVKSPPGHFQRADRCRFRFRFRFAPGVNDVHLDFPGPAPWLSGATYRIHGSVRAGKLWSWPIVRADIHHPEWARVTCENLGRVSRDYDVDVPYIDAVNIWRASDRGIFDALRDMLGGKVLGCEYSAELGYNMFRMTNVPMGAMFPGAGKMKVSDFARRVHERFTRLHYHRHGPASSDAPHPLRAFEVLSAEVGSQAPIACSEGPSRGVIPALHLDYRNGRGMDEPTRQAVLAARRQ